MVRKHLLRFVSDITKDIWKQIYSCKDENLDYDGWGFLWSCGFAAGLWRWTVEPEVSLHSDYLSLTRTTLRTPPRGLLYMDLTLWSGDRSLQSKATSRLRLIRTFTVHHALWGILKLYDLEPICCIASEIPPGLLYCFSECVCNVFIVRLSLTQTINFHLWFYENFN